MKSIFAIILSSAAALGFANDPEVPNLSSIPEMKIESETLPYKGTVYVLMRVSETDPLNRFKELPGIGLGYRRNAGNSALDFSFSYSQKIADRNHWHLWTFPKVSYLRYFSASSNNSLYLGGGMSWGGVIQSKRRGEDHYFVGLSPCLTLGYEMNRLQAWRGFLQFDIGMPAIAMASEGNWMNPFAELSVGFGF